MINIFKYFFIKIFIKKLYELISIWVIQFFDKILKDLHQSYWHTKLCWLSTTKFMKWRYFANDTICMKKTAKSAVFFIFKEQLI